MPVLKKVDLNFFKAWSPDMAYVLGFFVADGNMMRGRRGNHYVAFYSCDRDVLEYVKDVMGAEHKIGRKNRNNMKKNWKDAFRLQIGNKEMFEDLIALGLTPNKSKTCRMPRVPKKYLADFVRGYFDGDGNVWSGTINKSRSVPTAVLFSALTSGSKLFLHDLGECLEATLGTRGSLCASSGAYRLQYSTLASLRLHGFMYNKVVFYLPRKEKVFSDFIDRRIKRA